ncbi:MAG: glucosaminidase domain-containing protein [Selenomonadaceae bacterium]|nr:glucosaminidase domain-containing protein [Selenomonadaceae bacterium]
MLNVKRLTKLISAFVIGAVAISAPLNADAKRIHDSKSATKTEARKSSTKSKTTVVEKKVSADDGANISAAITPHEILTPAEFNSTSYFEDYFEAEDFYVPETVSIYDTSIIGTPMATQEQCVRYLLNHNPYPNLPISAEEIVSYYYEEGAREGIRPDVAFAQALKETGFFKYGGDVIPEQNNYCGLGTTGGGVKGEFFATPQMGVRAHIQHLLAYSSTRRPFTPIIDPRYDIVRNAYGDRILGDWQDLNGRWAVPGKYYGQEILSMFKSILAQ